MIVRHRSFVPRSTATSYVPPHLSFYEVVSVPRCALPCEYGPHRTVANVMESDEVFVWYNDCAGR